MKLIILLAGLTLFTVSPTRAHAQARTLIAKDSVNARVRSKVKQKPVNAPAKSAPATQQVLSEALGSLRTSPSDSGRANAAGRAVPIVPQRSAPVATRKKKN